MPTGLAGIRDFRLLWISGLSASLGAQMSLLALPLLVLRQTGSPARAGAIGTVSAGALLLTMLPGGALADSVERRRLMRLCDVGSLVVVSALAVSVLAGRSPLALVLLTAAAGAVITSFYGPAALGLLRTVVPTELLGAASARMQARGAAARLVGPLVGGALFAWEPAAPFVAEAVALLVSTACLAFVRTRSVPTTRTGGMLDRREIAAGVVFLWRHPYLRTVLLVFGLGMNFAFSAMMFVALTVASDRGHSGVGGGLIASLAAAGTLTGSLLAPRLRPDQRSGVFVSATCWVCTAAVAVLLVARPPLLIGLLAAACMAMASLASVGFLTSLLLATPEAMVGRVQSAASFLSSLVQPLGPLAAGVLLGASGEVATLGLVGALFAISAGVLTWAPRRYREPSRSAPTSSDGTGHDTSWERRNRKSDANTPKKNTSPSR